MLLAIVHTVGTIWDTGIYMKSLRQTLAATQ